MTKDEYDDFKLRYKGCGAVFPLYIKLSRFEKMWFTAIQKDVSSLETQIKTDSIHIRELQKQNGELSDKNKLLMKDVLDYAKRAKKAERENKELEYKLSEISKRFEPQAFTDLMDEVEENFKNKERVKELEAQIEKMKCPWTCKKFSNCKLSNCPCDDWEMKKWN